MLKTLALFDIDGTLLTTGGAGRTSLKQALEAVYGTAGPVYDYHMGGRTIREIVRDLLTAAGVDEAAIWPRFDEAMALWPGLMREQIPQRKLAICPGAHAVVDAAFAHEGVLPGILTANIEATAHIKLDAAGFDPARFPLGAYGDLSLDRADLVPAAVAQAKALTGRSFAPREVVLLGDSPLDVETAHRAGVRSIAVLTGGATREAMEAAAADVIFEDFSDTEAVLAAILNGA